MADATQKNIVLLVRCNVKNAYAIAGIHFPPNFPTYTFTLSFYGPKVGYAEL